MIRNASLHLVTDRADGEVRSSVDQAYTCPAASPGALRAYVDQSLRADRASPICTALRNHREILSHRGLDAVPFFQATRPRRQTQFPYRTTERLAHHCAPAARTGRSPH